MTSSKDLYQQTVQEQRSAPNELEANIASPVLTLSRVLPTLRNLDAAAIDTLARALVTEVAEGTRNGVDLFTLITKLSLFADTVKENVKGYVYGKTLCEKGSTYTLNGVELSPAELGVKYDYASTKDPEWIALNGAFEMAKKAKEEREKFLKGIKGKLNTFDDDTGETTTIYEPVKSGQSGYKTKTL